MLRNAEQENGIRLTLNVEQQENIVGGTSGKNPPSRQVPNIIKEITKPVDDENYKNTDQQHALEDKASATRTITNLEKQDAEEVVNMHSDELGGEEKPPLREVTIDIEAD